MLNVFSSRSADDFDKQLFTFIWNFNTGDNIVYNYKILQALYAAMISCKHEDRNYFIKPITIILVSIAEAVFVDFLDRLDQGTRHLPNNIDKTTIQAFKEEVARTKKPVTHDVKGEEYIYLKRKMYHWIDLVRLFKKHEVFGPESDDLYGKLEEFGRLRNRIHIENYHNNFDSKERKVFTETSLGQLEEILESIFSKMISDYPRPWPSQWNS